MTMEIARHWRQSRARKQDKPEIIVDTEREMGIIRMWGGEVPITKDEELLKQRLIKKGFNGEDVEELLFQVRETVATKASISNSEVVEGFLKLLGSEVREESRSEV